ncbi:MAG: CSLREA domain-containing protein [Anaerolineae bacterium]
MNARRSLTRWLAGALLLSLGLGLLAAPALGQTTTYTVNTTDDTDDGTCNAAHCSLREALNAANANPGPETIAFNIPGAGPHVIQPTTPLPFLSGSSTTLDGYTQAGAAVATATSPAVLKVILDGSASGATCLRVIGSQNTIRGLAIARCFGEGIWLYSSGPSLARGNVIAGNHIGTDAAGTADQGCATHGVMISSGASYNTVGGAAPADRNVISGNDWAGVSMADAGTQDNTVVGNYIGTDATGTAALGNAWEGVRIFRGAQGNTVRQNVISGNSSQGVFLSDPGTERNAIWGNFVGTDATGTAALPNTYDGVYIGNLAAHNTVGGDTPERRNVISGNRRNGLLINADHNTVVGNFVGVDVTGAAGLGNGNTGLELEGGHHNTIGGDTAGERNVISANRNYGIYVRRAEGTGNVIQGNYIGTDAAGTAGLGNARDGVRIAERAPGNTVGPGNVIAGNGWGGVAIDDGAEQNVVTGNRIGLDAAGAPLPNGYDGVYVTGGALGTTVGPANEIAHHVGSGVTVYGAMTYRVTITQNSIHDNIWGIRVHGGANQGMVTPAIASATVGAGGWQVGGTACAGCTVELFVNPDADGEGVAYIGQATAGGDGAFQASIQGCLAGSYLTATATDTAKGTSQFSSPFSVAGYCGYFPAALRQH